MIYYKMEQFDQFHCIGSDCPYTCCGGDWTISVDKKTDSLYRTIEGEFGDYLKANVIRTPSGAMMNRRADSLCAMISKEGLCRVQMELGEEALCDTCRIYPRIYRQVGDITLMSMTPSCPEVGRELLRLKEPLNLLQAEVAAEGEAEEKLDALLRRAFLTSFKILQEKKSGIAQRQKLFLLFNQAFHTAREAQDREKMEGLLTYFEDPSNYRTLAQENMDCNLSSKLHVITGLCPLFAEGTSAKEIRAVFNRVLGYLSDMKDGEKQLEKIKRYLERLDTGKHERGQENILLNGLLKHYLDKSFDDNLYLQSAYIVMFNQLMRIFSAIGSAREDNFLPANIRVMYLCFLARGIEHSEALRNRFNEMLLKEGVLELPFLFQLIS